MYGSPRPRSLKQKFETKIHRSIDFAQANLRIDRERQEHCAREAAWRLAKNILKRKVKQKTIFFSATEKWWLPAPFKIRPEERTFVVDSPTSMHMISKKDVNSAELEKVKVSRTPITVVTANGEVQTHEEATVYVKELDIFLTAKILENTPAELSLGMLFEHHGYSYECTCRQQPCLIKNGVRIQCSTENYVPIVVLGLSTSSSSSSSLSGSTSPTSVPQESKSSTSIPASSKDKITDDKGRWNPSTLDHKVRWNPCSSDIPEWLQEFRENLEDERAPEHGDSHASSSHEPCLEPTTKRREDLGKRSVYTHFPKDRNCKICQRTEITRAPCRRRTGEDVQEKLVTWQQQVTKFLVKNVNLETITDMQSWCKTWLLNGYNLIHVKQKLRKELKGACKSS